MLHNAIDAYHELLTPEIAEASQYQLTEQLKKHGLFFGERPLMSVLRPRFIALEQYRFLQSRCQVLLRAFDKTYRRAISDSEFRSQFGLFDWEETLIVDDPGFAEASPLSRLDAFFVSERGGVRFTEYNAETPAGGAYNDVLSEVVYGLPVMRKFIQQFDVRPLPSRHNILHALLHSYAQFIGNERTRPRIGILDWSDVPTRHEFVLNHDYFESQGFDTVVADVNDTEYRDGKLYASGQPIDVIYKRVLINELVEQGGLDHPIVRAVRERAVCMVNPFRCKILHKKMSLAVLSDERNRGMYDDEEQNIIDTHIPWTRRVEERKTEFRGDVVDMLPMVVENKDRFVLKPNDDYGGAGIVLGWLVDGDEWSRALRHAMTEPFIVQERIELPIEKYPTMVNGELHIEDRIEDTAPFCFHGQFMDGAMSRISTESLVNVTAGGGSSVPTMIAGPR